MILMSFSAFMGTLAMGIIFNIRKSRLLAASLLGGTSYLLYLLLQEWTASNHLAIFISSSFIGISGEILARIYRCPSTVFVIPSIVSLVPGAGMYYTMLYLAQNEYQNAINAGTQTVFAALSIACGLSFALALRRIIKKFRAR